jgi:hypothetical protein
MNNKTLEKNLAKISILQNMNLCVLTNNKFILSFYKYQLKQDRVNQVMSQDSPTESILK